MTTKKKTGRQEPVDRIQLMKINRRVTKKKTNILPETDKWGGSYYNIFSGEGVW